MEMSQLAKVALAALRANHQWHLTYADEHDYTDSSLYMQNLEAIHRLETALAQPVAWITLPDFQALLRKRDGYRPVIHRERIGTNDIPLFTYPHFLGGAA